MSWRPYITRRLPIAILFIVAIITIANYFLKGSPELSTTASLFRNWALIIFTYTLIVGLIQLTILRARRAMNPRETPRRRYLSMIFLAEMWIVTLLGLLQGSQAYNSPGFRRRSTPRSVVRSTA
jgi:hypothetical protein